MFQTALTLVSVTDVPLAHMGLQLGVWAIIIFVSWYIWKRLPQPVAFLVYPGLVVILISVLWMAGVLGEMRLLYIMVFYGLSIAIMAPYTSLWKKGRNQARAPRR